MPSHTFLCGRWERIHVWGPIMGSPSAGASAPSHSFALHPPSSQVEVITPEDHMGDVIGDLNSRRGMVNKFEDKPGKMKLVSVSRGGWGLEGGRWREETAQQYKGTRGAVPLAGSVLLYVWCILRTFIVRAHTQRAVHVCFCQQRVPQQLRARHVRTHPVQVLARMQLPNN